MDESERQEALERMQHEAKHYFRSAGNFRTAPNLAEACGRDDTRWLEQLNVWKQNREVFSIQDEGPGTLRAL